MLLPPDEPPPDELLPDEPPLRAGFDEEPPEAPVVEREVLPPCLAPDVELAPERWLPWDDLVVVDEPVVVRVVVPVLTLTPGLERRCTTTAGRRLWMMVAWLAGACTATRARLGRFTCLFFLMMVRVAGSPDTAT